MCFMRAEPITQLARPPGQPRIFRLTWETVHPLGRDRRVPDFEALYPNEVTDRVEVALRVSFEIIVKTGQHIVAAKRRLPFLQSRCLAAPILGNVGFEIVAPRPHVAAGQLIEGVNHFDWIAERTDYFAVRNMLSDPRQGLIGAEIARTNFPGR